MKHVLFAFAFIAAAVQSSAQDASALSAAYQRPTMINVAPGQIVTFYVHGIGAKLTTRVDAVSLPLPTTLAGISALFLQQPLPIAVPIVSVDPIATCSDLTRPGCSSYTAVTVQIPYLIAAGSVNLVSFGPPLTTIEFLENGAPAAAVDVNPFYDQIHVLRECDEMIAGNPYTCSRVQPMFGSIVTHSDGSRVTFTSPAKPGEQVQIYAVGLGPPDLLPFPDGVAVSSPTPVRILGISFDARPNALPSRPSAFAVLTQPVFAGLIPGYVGLYQVNVIVPGLGPEMQPCQPNYRTARIDSNLTINVIGVNSFDGAAICVDTSSH